MRRKSCQVMIKPTGSVCNLDCQYCFYLEKEKLYPDRNNNFRMSESTLENLVQQHIAAQEIDEVIFAWQGGEPTLMGIDFYRKAVALQKRYANGKRVINTFQTNGVLVDDRWCAFFKEHAFLVGISIDGDAVMHDKWRVTRSGKPTHKKVEQAIYSLRRHGVEFNTLTVVSQANASQALDVYRYLKNAGSQYMQFIPLVERGNITGDGKQLAHPKESQTQVMPWSVGSMQFGKFLSAIFDVWIREDIGNISVQLFEQTLAAWCDLPPQVCIFAPRCGSAFALEMNGDVYNCDHYVYADYKLGNINQTSLKEMNNGAQNLDFAENKYRNLSGECHSCPWLFACYGGCPKHRFLPSLSGDTKQNYLCEGYRYFFDHTAEIMGAMKTLFQHGHSPADIKTIFR
ncbi:anaerobic sulfatase maturase [Phytobacter sp. AG2a]